MSETTTAEVKIGNKPCFEIKVEHPDAQRYTLADIERGWISGVFAAVAPDGEVFKDYRFLVYTSNCCPCIWQVDYGRPRPFQREWFTEKGYYVFQRVSEKITVVFQ